MEDGEEIGEAVAEVVEEISAEAKDEIAIAKEHADHAQRVAQEMTDAALATAHGQRVNEVEERLNQWQSRMETERSETLAKLEAMEANLMEKLNSGLSSLTLPNSIVEPKPEEIPQPEAEIPANLENVGAPKEPEPEVEIVGVRKPVRRWM